MYNHVERILLQGSDVVTQRINFLCGIKEVSIGMPLKTYDACECWTHLIKILEMGSYMV